MLVYKSFILLFYIISSSVGFVLLKKASFLSIEFFIGNILYIVGYLIWILIILKAFPLSIGFPLAAGGLLIASQLMGSIFLNEKLDIYNFVAIFFIILGLSILMYKDFKFG